METKKVAVWSIAAMVLACPAAHAEDIWDRTGNDDSAATTRTEIAPGEFDTLMVARGQ